MPSLYSDFLAAGHEGMQHWSSWPVNYHEIRERALTPGWQIGQEGDTPRGPFIYFLNEGHPGTVIEMAEATPVRMRIFDQVREAARHYFFATNVEVLHEGIDNYYLPSNGTTRPVRVSGNIQLSGWPDQCFSAGANNANIGSAQVRQSHWVFGGSVSYGTDHRNHFLSSIRNEPRRLVRVQNVLQLCG